MQIYQYHATITKVIDGDTVDATVDLGFKVFTKIRVRLARINTPEINSKDEAERLAAQKAKDYLTSIALNKEIHLDSKSYDKYGRAIGEIYLLEDNTISINQLMINQGYAKEVSY